MKQKTNIPAHLSPKSKALWEAIERRYALDEAAHSLLQVACEALDRLAESREIIERDGLVIGEGDRVRRHPALDIEKQSASIFLRAWRDLGFDKSEGAQALKEVA